MNSWNELLHVEAEKHYFKNLMHFIDDEYATHTIYPPRDLIFNALATTPYDATRVVILGQDPYHQPGQAMGLSFSVASGCPNPKSLINMYKELETDLRIVRKDGDLTHWANQGVLLLNTLLTVRKNEPLSHQGKGWEIFTDEIIKALGKREKPLIFVLWGKHAQSKEKMIEKHHCVIKAPHPSPLSAYRGFFGSKPYSRINEKLLEWGEHPIDWS